LKKEFKAVFSFIKSSSSVFSVRCSTFLRFRATQGGLGVLEVVITGKVRFSATGSTSLFQRPHSPTTQVCTRSLRSGSALGGVGAEYFLQIIV